MTAKQTAYNAIFYYFSSFVLSVGLLILSGLVWHMGSGFVSSALGNTGASESISGKHTGMHHRVDSCRVD